MRIECDQAALAFNLRKYAQMYLILSASQRAQPMRAYDVPPAQPPPVGFVNVVHHRCHGGLLAQARKLGRINQCPHQIEVVLQNLG
eukprot:3921485-Alexandrium_andersonii.AAC.1